MQLTTRRPKSPAETTKRYDNKYELDNQDLESEEAYVPQSKTESIKEYTHWKITYEEDLNSCLKKFKQCSLKDVSKVKANKDSTESLRKRKKKPFMIIFTPITE